MTCVWGGDVVALVVLSLPQKAKGVTNRRQHEDSCFYGDASDKLLGPLVTVNGARRDDDD